MHAPTTPLSLRLVAIVVGPALALTVYALLAGSGLDHAPRAVAGVGVWMALWWMTEAVHLAVTSLLPVLLFPMLGVSTLGQAAAPFVDPLVVLFFAGFVLGLAVEKWGLHQRFALRTVLLFGTRPARLIGGFMLATAVLSCFINNTATAMMMLPIATSVIALFDRLGVASEGREAFAPAILLGVAYAASIGGVTTITGTQPNILLVGFLRDEGVKIEWAQWLPLGLTLLAVMLPSAWFILTRVSLRVPREGVPGVDAMLRQELRDLGPMSRPEKIVLATFACVAAGWIFRGLAAGLLADHGFEWVADRLHALGDAGVALAGALVLFVIPVDRKRGVFVMDWPGMARMPWDVLLLFGGGLALAGAIKSTGLDEAVGGSLSGLRGLPPIVIIVVVSAAVLFLTELSSNTATVAACVPILGSAAPAVGVHPALLMLPAGIVASYGFMLPVGTPPNAIVFGSGRLTIGQMCRAGLLVNIVGVVVTTLVVSQLGGVLLGIDLNPPPVPVEHPGLP